MVGNVMWTVRIRNKFLQVIDQTRKEKSRKKKEGERRTRRDEGQTACIQQSGQKVISGGKPPLPLYSSNAMTARYTQLQTRKWLIPHRFIFTELLIKAVQRIKKHFMRSFERYTDQTGGTTHWYRYPLFTSHGRLTR